MLLFLETPVTMLELLTVVAVVVFIFMAFIWYENRQRWPNMDDDVVAPSTTISSLRCKLTRFVRRGSWFFLLLAIDAAYPFVSKALLYFQTVGLSGNELDRAVAEAGGKLVDPVQFYSKSWIAFSTFCQINALGWAALLVVPVLIDWAIGFYKDEQGEYPATRGFKGTFLLKLTDWQRILIFVIVWGIELMIAAHSVDSAFRMQ